MREAVILAGGLGTRLRAAVPDLPKPMAPIAGRPFLERLLGSLDGKGFNRVVLSLGYLAESVIDHFGNRFRGIELVYAVEPTPLGTGGALRLALSRCISDHVFVFNGDTFIDLDITAVHGCWLQRHVPIVVARQVRDTARYGRLSVLGDRVVGLSRGVEGDGLINAGCYVLPTNLLASGPARERFSFETDFLAEAVKTSPFEVFLSEGQFIDIGVPQDFRRAQIELKNLGA